MKRPILYITIPFCAGIFLARFFSIPAVFPIVLSSIFIMLALLRQDKNIFSHASLYLAVFLFGIAYYQNSIQLSAGHIANYAKDVQQKVLVRGVVVDDPIMSQALYGKEKTTFTLKADALKDGEEWKGVTGLAKVSAYSDKALRVSYGDELVFEGSISKPHSLKNPGVFDYEEYLAVKDIYAVISVKDGTVKKIGSSGGYFTKTAYKFRNAIRNIFDKYLDEPYSGFLNAINIGDRSALSDAIKDDFVKTGTVHILAISGLNVGLIAAIVLAFFGILRLPKKLNLTLTLIFLAFYTFVAGANPPIVRATVMFAVFVVGYLIDREADALNSLSLAAFLMLLWNPKELFDPSFQLSFASIASIIIFVPKMNELVGFKTWQTGDSVLRKTARYLYVCTAASAAAWLGTWPITLAYFNIISPVSILANLIVIPLLFVLTAASFIFAAAGFMSGLLASALAPFLKGVTQFLFISNHLFAKIPFAYFRPGAMNAVFLFFYYAAIMSLPFISVEKIRNMRIKSSKIILAVLVVLNVIVWAGNAAFEKDILKITFLDVGNGDAAFIELPGGWNILIDGGQGGVDGTYDMGGSVVAPYLWHKGITKIDAVIMTHFHADHMGGLIYVLENFKIGCVIDNGVVLKNNFLYKRYKNILISKKIEHFSVGEGDRIIPTDEVKIYVMNPPKEVPALEKNTDENDNSIALRLVYKKFSAFFCGDITSVSMSRIISGDFSLRSDVIKIPHHGGRLGNEKIVSAFFEEVQPRACITSRGAKVGWGSEVSEKSKSITSFNSNSYETFFDGAVEISSDGSSDFAIKTYSSKN